MKIKKNKLKKTKKTFKTRNKNVSELDENYYVTSDVKNDGRGLH